MNAIQISYLGTVLLSTLTSLSGLKYPSLKGDTEEGHWPQFRFGSDIKSTKSYGISTNLNAVTLLSAQHKVHHRRLKGKYSVKEEIVKRVERIHPCSLEATAVKVTFPGIKSEVLVSFLGYKEPNLIHVNRCKGRCNGSSMDLACVPIRRNMKKIRMHLRTQVIGSEKKKDKVKELILEEHMECGCTCLSMNPSSCPSPALFSNETCSCSCESSPEMGKCYGPDRFWDPRTCSCVTGVSPPNEEETSNVDRVDDAFSKSTEGDQQSGFHFSDLSTSYVHRIEQIQKKDSGDYSPCSHCLECMNMAGISSVYKKRHGGSPIIKSWIVLVFSLVLIIFLFCTTLHYWRKSHALLKSLRRDEDFSKMGSNLFLDASSIPIELTSDHQINFDHNGDGTMAELFNPSSSTAFLQPSTPILFAGNSSIKKETLPVNGSTTLVGNNRERSSSSNRNRSSSRGGEKKKRSGGKNKDKGK